MKSAVSSLVRSNNSPISRTLLYHSSKPISQSPFFLSNTPKNLFNQRYQKLQFSPNSTSIMASLSKSEQAREPPALPLPSPPLSKAISFFFCLFICFIIALIFKIGLCQLSVTPDKERNIKHARKAIEEAAQKGAQLVLLPEIWNSPYSNDSFPVYAEDIDAGGDASPSTAMLSEVASRLKITIVGGSIPERCGDKLYNACCVFGTDGKLKAKHRKIHLFDIDIPGKITFMESKTLTAGETPTVVDTDVGRIGIGICYDIRFTELAMIYAARGAHLICYPGAFNMTTGPLHWELSQRASCSSSTEFLAVPCAGLWIIRKNCPSTIEAVKTYVDSVTLYVATCSPARDPGAGYVAWGHSTLVGPGESSLHETTTRRSLQAGGHTEAQLPLI
uniref:CN hydrolase domain-containing protein n=1 Tax=Gossypium hirsutum TaxID=3635 RepID=A0A346KJY4_GOSHI|nr:hypothetical protein Gohir.A07G020600 [Gossypium hirsutum]